MNLRRGVAVSFACCCIPLYLLPIRNAAADGASKRAGLVQDIITARSADVRRDFPKDVPVFPGLEGIAATNDRGVRTITGVSGKAPNMVLDYYEKVLPENGWSKTQTQTESDAAALVFEKDGRQLHVGTYAKPGRPAFVSLTHYDAGASPEARRAAAGPDEPEARAIMDCMAKAYAECATYRDTGAVTETYFEENMTWAQQVFFSTAFVRPNRFRLEYRDQLASSSRWYLHIVHSDASGVRTFGDPCESGVVQEESLSTALAGADEASVVPDMLLPGKSETGAMGLFELKRLPDEESNGVACYRIDGLDGTGGRQSLWIDRQTLLLRKVAESMAFDRFRTETVTTYQPESGVSISDKELEFAAPGVISVAMADAREVVALYLAHAGLQGYLIVGSALLLAIAVGLSLGRRLKRRAADARAA